MVQCWHAWMQTLGKVGPIAHQMPTSCIEPSGETDVLVARSTIPELSLSNPIYYVPYVVSIPKWLS